MRSHQVQHSAYVLYVDDTILRATLSLECKISQLYSVLSIRSIAFVNFRGSLNVGLEDDGQYQGVQIEDGRNNVEDKEKDGFECPDTES